MNSNKKLINVYKASAGSGKTFALAAEFIANLLNDFGKTKETHAHQLAITFTKKATTEMKERILENLYELAHCGGSNSAFLAAVRSKLSSPISDDEISLRSQILLRQILHGYDRFYVTTIDSFFQSLLSNLAHELGLSATFKVDLNNDDVLRRAVDKMLSELTPDSDELNCISEHIKQKLVEESDKSWRVERTLFEFSKELTKESYLSKKRLMNNNSLSTKSPYEYIKELANYKKQQISGIKTEAKSVDKFIVGTEGYKSISRGSNVQKYLVRAKEYNFSKTDPSNTVVNIANDSSVALKAADKKNGSLCSWADDLSDKLEALLAKVEKSAYHINSCDLSLRYFNEYRLLDAIAKSVESISSDNDTFLLAYTPILFAELVGKDEASFVFERAGTQFNHVMIDEFQDTSKLQWQNLRNLFLENISQGNSCMLVGDVKQGIYRWRGGDWLGLAQIQPDALTEVQTLDSNYRSGEVIVDFNNKFFVKIAEVIEELENEEFANSSVRGTVAITSLYEESLVKQNPVHKGGFVRVYMDKTSKKGGAAQKVEESTEGLYSTEELRQNAEGFSPEDDLREQILRLHKEGVPFDKMGILVRGNKETSKLIEYFTDYENKHKGDDGFVHIELVSDEAYKLTASRGVQLIIKALQYIRNSTDGVSLEYVLKHCPEKNREAVHKLLEEWKGMGYRMLPFYDLIQQLIQHLELYEQPGEASYLYALLDMVVSFLDDNVPDIGRFLDYFESAGNVSVPASVVKGVRIMTVHKSKGLDFHSVFIPYCNWGLVSADNLQPVVWTEPKGAPYDAVPVLPVKMNKLAANSIYKDEYELERRDQHIENLNLLYVAFTRARQNLVICVPKGNANSIVPALETTIKELFLNKSVDNVRFEEDDTMMLLEISQPSSAECIAPSQATEKDDANEGDCVSTEQGSAAEEKGRNPFKINAVTEKIELTLCKNETKFRQSQNARLFIAALNEEVRAKESDGAPLSLNPIVKEDADFFAKRAAAQRRGTLLHRLMEDIESEKDVERVLQTAVSEGKIAPLEEIGELKKMLRKAMEHEVAKAWFDGTWQLYRECSILTRDAQGTVITQRPDRVMMRGDEAIVVDYKFGVQQQSYHDQVKRYCQLIQQMGKQHVKGYLWYVDKDFIEEVV